MKGPESKVMSRLLIVLVALTCSPSLCLAAGLQLSIQDGRVSLDAQDVTVRQILAEWARVGQTRIVNGERVSGGPVTIKFEAVPEKQALDIILRNVPGYMAAPRETLVANASRYDTIMIMATTTAVAVSRPPPSPSFGGRQGNLGNVTQLLQAMPPSNIAPEPADAADDQIDDPAIAAAAAAGLIIVPAPSPAVQPPSMSPVVATPGTPASTPAAGTPSNPWNAPVGTAQPSLAPPPEPPTTQPAQPILRPRPPQADR